MLFILAKFFQTKSGKWQQMHFYAFLTVSEMKNMLTKIMAGYSWAKGVTPFKSEETYLKLKCLLWVFYGTSISPSNLNGKSLVLFAYTTDS